VADGSAGRNKAIGGAFLRLQDVKRVPSEWSRQMNRRFLLASIATLSAGRVVAQQLSQPAPAPSAGTDAQQKHVRDTMAYGSLSLLLSRMAKPKVSHPLLKQFVDFEIAEQETVGGILKAILTNAAPSGDTPSPSDADLMRNLDEAGKASVEKLRALKAGFEFDRDYIRYETEGHRKLLDIQEVYLKSPDNLDETNVAKLARGMIKEHLTLLAEIDKAA
jgi:putative membrane protein